MNPFSKLGCHELTVDSLPSLKTELTDFLKKDKYTAVVCPFEKNSMQFAMAVNEVTREMEVPFYAPNSTGLQAFFYADLGKEKFDFTHVQKKGKADDAEGVIEETLMASKEGSLTLKTFLDKFLDPKDHLSWKKREVARAHKILLLCIAA